LVVGYLEGDMQLAGEASAGMLKHGLGEIDEVKLSVGKSSA
jgi:hypothetical protein